MSAAGASSRRVHAGRSARRCEQPGENDNEYSQLVDTLRCPGWPLSRAPGSKMSWPPFLQSG